MAEPLLDPRAIALAKLLAERTGTTPTQAIIAALEAEIARDEVRPQASDEFDRLADELLAKSKLGGREMTREDIDAMWGQ